MSAEAPPPVVLLSVPSECLVASANPTAKAIATRPAVASLSFSSLLRRDCADAAAVPVSGAASVAAAALSGTDPYMMSFKRKELAAQQLIAQQTAVKCSTQLELAATAHLGQQQIERS
jgi:hypothetical protein